MTAVVSGLVRACWTTNSPWLKWPSWVPPVLSFAENRWTIPWVVSIVEPTGTCLPSFEIGTKPAAAARVQASAFAAKPGGSFTSTVPLSRKAFTATPSTGGGGGWGCVVEFGALPKSFPAALSPAFSVSV